MTQLLRALATLVLAVPLAAAAALDTPTRVVLEPVTITDFAAPGAAITRTFRIVTKEKKITSVRAVVSTLRDDATGRAIDANRITVADVAMTPNLPSALSISIAGVEQAGTYTGSIELYSVAEKKSLGRVAIVVTTRLKPSLGPPPTAAYDFVRCSFCRLSDLLLPDTMHDAKAPRSIDIPKLNAAAVKVVAADVVGRGVVRGTQVPRHALRVDLRRIHDTRPVVSLPLDVKLEVLEPDKYSGTIYLSVADLDAPVAVPFEINVRDGAGLALLTIIVGILFGWLVAFMERVGNKQAEYLLRLGAIEQRLSDRDAIALEGEMNEVRERIYEAQVEGLDATIKSLEERSLRLRELAEYERALDAGDALRTKIQAARVLLWKNDEKAIDAVQAIRAEVAGRGAAKKDVGRAFDQELHAVENISPPYARVSLRGFFARLTPTIRPALRIVLLIVLALLGMYAVYVANPTFGARRLNDYLALFLWGVASDVASKTLSSAATLLPKR
jgi:exonuclease VII small subunit